MRVDVCTTRDAVESLSGQWNELLDSSEARTIFLTWEWISTWLDMVHPTARLLVIVVRDEDDTVVAIAPFYRTRLRLLGLIPYKCLRVLGDVETGAEYPDIIIRRGFEEQATELVMAALLEHRQLWDCLWFPNLAGWSGSLARVQSLCSPGNLHVHERERVFSAVSLPDTYDAYLQLLSANARSNIKRRTKRLLSSHRVELVRCERDCDLPEMLSHLYDLNHRRWRLTGRAGTFVRRPRMKQFYDHFSPIALTNDWLRLYALRVDGAVRAVQYGYKYNGAYHQLQEGFDPEAPTGIGNVLRSMVVKACIQEGLREYDFLGGFADHKRRWGAIQRSGHDVLVGRRSMKNGALFVKQIWPTGRWLRQ